MKPYQRINESTELTFNEAEYKQFRYYVISSDYGRRLNEFGIPKGILEKIDFIKTLAVEIGVKVKDLFKLFIDKFVFTLFSKIGWSLEALFDLLKNGYKHYCELQNAISEYIAKTKVVEWTAKHLKDLDEYLKKHPKVKRIVGIATAGLLIYVWFTMSFTGDVVGDFDLSHILGALTGSYALADLFSSGNGVKMLLLFATGALTGLTFPWVGSSIAKFGFAVIFTLGKALKHKIQKGHDANPDKELQSVGVTG